MIEFPLLKQLRDRAIKNKEYDVKKVCSRINSLPDNQLEIVQALILYYYASTGGGSLGDGSTKFRLPYGGKVFDGGRGCLFTLSTLPRELQDLLAVFVDHESFE